MNHEVTISLYIKFKRMHEMDYIYIVNSMHNSDPTGHTSHCEEEDDHLWYQLGTVISQGNPVREAMTVASIITTEGHSPHNEHSNPSRTFTSSKSK